MRYIEYQIVLGNAPPELLVGDIKQIASHSDSVEGEAPPPIEQKKTVYSEGEKKEKKPYHSLHTSISGWVLKNRISLISKDIKSDSRFRQSVFKNIAVKSVLCTPLYCEDQIIGMLLLLNKTDDSEFKDADLLYLEKL